MEENLQYFALLDENNIVINVIVCSSEEIVNFPGRWIEGFRDRPKERFPSIGDTYDEEYKEFFPPLSPALTEEEKVAYLRI